MKPDYARLRARRRVEQIQPNVDERSRRGHVGPQRQSPARDPFMAEVAVAASMQAFCTCTRLLRIMT